MMSVDAQTRRQIIDRDGGECINCESEDKLHVHHIVQESEGGTDDPSNLVTLCVDCHYEEHGHGVGTKLSTTIELGEREVLEGLNPTDRAILSMLRDGRCTNAYIANEHGYSRANVSLRLDRLVEHGYVERLHRGLYELVNDPRD